MLYTSIGCYTNAVSIDCRKNKQRNYSLFVFGCKINTFCQYSHYLANILFVQFRKHLRFNIKKSTLLTNCKKF